MSTTALEYAPSIGGSAAEDPHLAAGAVGGRGGFGVAVWAAGVKRGVLLYHQDRCLRYAAPADLVVYEAEQGAAAELLKRAGYCSMPNMSSSGTMAAYVPGALCGIWTVPLRTGSAGMRAAVLFMGELRTKNGSRRLVIVRGGHELRADAGGVRSYGDGVRAGDDSRDLRVVPPTDRMMMVWNGPVANGRRRICGSTPGSGLRASRIGSRSGTHWKGRKASWRGSSSADGTEVEFEIKSGPAVESVWAHPSSRQMRATSHRPSWRGFRPVVRLRGSGLVAQIWR